MTNSKFVWGIYSASILSTIIHGVLIAFGEWQDRHGHSGYTDIDYWVYSDAAHHVYHGGSAFDRHTYRYSPLLAWLLLPNEFIAGWWGKALFSAAGVIAGILIYRITNKNVMYASLWLFSPLTLNISTRGSSDSLLILLVLLVFHELRVGRLRSAAIWYGLSVHLRIFPIFFAIPIMFHIRSFRKIFLFGVISAGVCFGLIGFFYMRDGYRFIYEAYLYHFVRTDHRHNFSLFYYAIYLASSEPGSTLSRILSYVGFLTQLSSLFFVGAKFGKSNFMFAIFLQTIIFVAFNKVITAQYFLWYFGLLPVALHAVIEDVGPNATRSIFQIVISIIFWGISEMFWLHASYRLEAKSEHNFKQLLAASVALFFAHIGLCVVFINAFKRRRVHGKKPSVRAEDSSSVLISEEPPVRRSVRLRK